MERMGNGAARLAAVLDGRIKENQDTSLLLDFASVLEDYSILANTFPRPVPIRDCMAVCGAGRHLVPGDRVLVAWVQSELVIIDVVTSAKNVLGGDAYGR